MINHPLCLAVERGIIQLLTFTVLYLTHLVITCLLLCIEISSSIEFCSLFLPLSQDVKTGEKRRLKEIKIHFLRRTPGVLSFAPNAASAGIVCYA